MLTQLRDHPDRALLGIDLVGVSHREQYQAHRLVQDGIGVPLLLDPDGGLRQLYGIEQRFGWRGVFNPRSIATYGRAWRRQRKRSDPIWTQTRVRPGLLLLGDDDRVLWSRVGEFLGDYLSADAVFAQAKQALEDGYATDD